MTSKLGISGDTSEMVETTFLGPVLFLCFFFAGFWSSNFHALPRTAQDQGTSQDQEFMSDKQWTELGGSTVGACLGDGRIFKASAFKKVLCDVGNKMTFGDQMGATFFLNLCENQPSSIRTRGHT